MLLTITGHNQELIIIVDIVDNDIREGSYDLLLRCKLGAFFELEITNSS